MSKRFRIVTVVIAVAVGIGLILAVVFSRIPPAAESWYQQDIIGQGTLTNVEMNGDMLLLSLQLGEYTPEGTVYITNVFCVDYSRLAIQHMPPTPEVYIEDDLWDTKRFEVGTWYTLFRKVSPLRYLLLSPPDRHEFPVSAPSYR